MCRLLAFWAYRENADVLDELLKAFVDACSNDPYLERVTGGAARCHCDGWGYALVVERDSAANVIYERFYTPNPEEHRESLVEATRRIMSLVREVREATLLIHCRKAGRTEPVGLSHTHPYREELSYYELFFAHNGSFRKDDLSLLTGRPSQLYTDSALAAKMYARLLEAGGEALDAARRLSFYTRTAYNTVSLLVERTTGRASITYTALTCREDPDRLDYYEAYILASRDMFVYASSTVAQYAERQGVELSWERVRGGQGVIGFYEKGQHVRQPARCPPKLD